MDSLEAYRGKRNQGRTPEPMPDPPGPATPGPAPAERGGPAAADERDRVFVVQEHHATALHWDFRLERDGVLVSWAVPKGLPVEPSTNHLAVHTEDHPLEYATFEGDIPEGEYGGGQVILWDTGTYECEKWTDREVKVTLHGSRVEGRYVLIKTGQRDRDWMVRRLDPAPAGFTPLPQLN